GLSALVVSLCLTAVARGDSASPAPSVAAPCPNSKVPGPQHLSRRPPAADLSLRRAPSVRTRRLALIETVVSSDTSTPARFACTPAFIAKREVIFLKYRVDIYPCSITISMSLFV
ncbi:unnamed protein product, partial [Urochloa humidicola]